jgi:signal transduction histidine kinase
MRKIFRLFYRIDSGLARETVGTGIGLALVRQLVEAMGGTVDVANCEPGAEFSVSLPRSRRLAGDAP